MKPETIIALAAAAGVAYLLWDRYNTNQRPSQSVFDSPVVYSTRPVRAETPVLMAPAGPTPTNPPGYISPNCQTPCPPGVNCAQALDGVWIGAGGGNGAARCVPVTRLIPQ